MALRNRTWKAKGVSTFIAVLLLMVLAVAAGVVIYAYTMGFLGELPSSTQTGTLQVQAAGESDGILHIYVKNIGGGDVKLDPGAIYLNGVPLSQVTDFSLNPPGSDVPEGAIVDIQVYLNRQPTTLNGKTSTIKVVTVSGSYVTTSVKITEATGVVSTPVVLTIIKDGSGAGTVTPDKSPPYTFGEVVTLTSTPNYDSDFAGWSGAGSGEPRVVSMNEDLTVTATFNLKVISLTINTGGGGAGTVTVDKSPPYTYGEVVQLTPIPKVNSVFTSWTIDGDGTGWPVLTANVTGSLHAIGIFDLKTFNITATAGLNGGITPIEATSVFYGADQTFDFIPDANYHVSLLTVDGVSVPNPGDQYTFYNVTANHTIDAQFAP